jgi:hypothetical protein
MQKLKLGNRVITMRKNRATRRIEIFIDGTSFIDLAPRCLDGDSFNTVLYGEMSTNTIYVSSRIIDRVKVIV